MRAFILTGSRDWTDEVIFPRALSVLTKPPWRPLMIHGAAIGADTLGSDYWRAIGLPTLPMPAQWKRADGSLDRSAGPRRNGEMLKVLLALRACGYAVSVEAFSLPQSRGTKNMKEIAEHAGVTVVEHGRIA